jgi:polyhydroxyalkanoate synthesis repressor PhaR
VLHGALQLATFTIEQLAELTGVKPTAVQSLVTHSRDLMEVVEPPPSAEARVQVIPGALYRLRESGRARVAREAVELSDRLRGPQRPPVAEVAQTVTVALEAVESSIELSRLAADQKSWQERAVVQLEVARRLAVLVKDYGARASLRRRVVQLATRLEGIELHLPAAPPVRKPPVPEARKLKGPRTIWRSPNRRLFDAAEQRFVTLVDIRKLVNGLVDFVVIDKRGRGDITRSILLQIIAELEKGSEPLLTQEFLLELIRSYGEMQSLVARYLDHSLKLLNGGQEESLRPH